MKNCTKCGQAIPDNAKFCTYCGEVAEEAQTSYTSPEQENTYYSVPHEQTPQGQREDEQKCLDSLSTRLGWERRAWKIVGIVFLILAIFFAVFGSVFLVAGGAVIADNASYSYDYYDDGYYYDDDYGYYSDNIDGEDFVGAFGLSFGMTYAVVGLIVYLPIAIVNFVMAKKVGKYKAKIYTDCTDAVDHAGSVGSIVLGALFNSIALVFIIINFVLVKNDKAKLERIKQTQAAYNAQYSSNI